jgi:nicotinate-nucleotide adenylyltransferase
MVAGGRASPAAVVPGRIGILGGTFDPIHVGHLAIGEDARQQLGLERVDYIPAGVPQLRAVPPTASAEDRAAMVELAIAGNPCFGIDRIEVAREGPTFAVDTLETLAARVAATGTDPDFWLILSVQSLLTLPSWKAPERLLQLTRLGVVPRPGAQLPDRDWVDANFPGYVDRITFLDGPLLDVSGTAVRDRLRQRLSVRYLVADAVIDYINDHRLYRT